MLRIPLLQPIVPLPTVEITNVNCTGTTTTSSTTTTTFSGTTTTLPPGAPLPCTIDFDLDDAVSLGSLQFDVDYLNAPGEFDGAGSGVQCSGLVPFSFTSSQDDEPDPNGDDGHHQLDRIHRTDVRADLRLLGRYGCRSTRTSRSS